MKQPIFIRLENSFEAAMEYRNSPEMNIYSFRGIQLLPSSPYVYVQRTYALGGINLENFTAVLRNSCDEIVLTGVENSIEIVRAFQDPDTGLSQIEWSFDTSGLECSDQLVYLDITQGANGKIYSSPFYLTDTDSERTSRWDYRNRDSETMLSTQLQVWYKDEDDLEEIEVYDTVSQSARKTIGGKLIPYEIWQTEIVRKDLFRLFKQLRRNNQVYCNLSRVMPFSAFETPRLVGRENFAEAEIELTFDYNDRYDPNYIPPPAPPTPPPSFLQLLSVEAPNTSQVIFTFNVVGVSVESLLFQRSLDQINWDGEFGQAVSPATIYLPGNDLNNYYYRLFDPATETASNILQLPAPAITITNIARLDNPFKPIGNTYFIQFTKSGFELEQYGYFVLDVSTDGVNWINNVIPNNRFTDSPVRDRVPYSDTEFKLFRIRYKNITSNIYNTNF